MSISKEIYFSMNETAEAVGVSVSTLMYHRQVRHVPEPERWGGRRVYTQSQYDAARAYFAGRKKYARIKAQETVR